MTTPSRHPPLDRVDSDLPTYHETLTSPIHPPLLGLHAVAAGTANGIGNQGGVEVRRRGTLGPRRRGTLRNAGLGGLGGATRSVYAHLGWPEGCFVLRNRVADRVLEVQECKTDDGTPLTPQLSLLHPKNNQIFFLDWSGYLTSASAGRPVDATPALPLFPFRSPTAASFGLGITSPASAPSPQPPQSPHYSPQYMTPSAPPAIPQHAMLQPVTPNSRTVFDISAPPPSATRENMQRTGLPQDPRTDEVDDSTSPTRTVRIVALQPGWREKFDRFENFEVGRSPGRISEEEEREMLRWRRRMWDCVAVVVQTEEERQAALLRQSVESQRQRERERSLQIPRSGSSGQLRMSRSMGSLPALDIPLNGGGSGSASVSSSISDLSAASPIATPTSRRRPAALNLTSATTRASGEEELPVIQTTSASPRKETSGQRTSPVEVVQEVGTEILQGIGGLVADARNGVKNAFKSSS
ncbi:hypothetical protein BT69DRAFT_1300894 [Atractiella rhizophila]|nr:hypothetical protein BT69DRAFT_1300894 [Atractiella rhizophila]